MNPETPPLSVSPMTPGEISGLRELVERTAEPMPRPLPEQDTRVGEAMAGIADDRARKDWAHRRKDALEQIASHLPSLLSALDAQQARIAELMQVLNRGRRSDEDCPIAAHLDDMYARSDDDQDKMHLAMAAYELRRGPFDHPDHFGCEIEADTLRERIAALTEALERCAVIVERNLGRQNEKVADVVLIARRAAALVEGA